MRVVPATLVRAVLLLLAGLPASMEAAEGRWTSQGPGGGPVHKVWFDPHNPSTVFAGGDRESSLFSLSGPPAALFKSVDGGHTWRAANRGLESEVIRGLAFDPDRPGVLLATSASRIFRSLDGGETWSELATVGLEPGPAEFGPIEFDPSRSMTVYLIRFWLYRSTDAGVTWSRIDLPVSPRSLVLTAARPSTVYAAE